MWRFNCNSRWSQSSKWLNGNNYPTNSTKFLSKSDTSDAKPKTLATKENADDLFDMIE